MTRSQSDYAVPELVRIAYRIDELKRAIYRAECEHRYDDARRMLAEQFELCKRRLELVEGSRCPA